MWPDSARQGLNLIMHLASLIVIKDGPVSQSWLKDLIHCIKREKIRALWHFCRFAF